jgi:hypothetical protein
MLLLLLVVRNYRNSRCHKKNLRGSLALTSVGSNVVGATEDLEGGITLDSIGGAELGFFGAVDLSELDVLLLQRRSSLLVLGGEGLAVTAPGSVDCLGDRLAIALLSLIPNSSSVPVLTFSENEIVRLDEFIESGLGKLRDVRALSLHQGKSSSQKAESSLEKHLDLCVWGLSLTKRGRLVNALVSKDRKGKKHLDGRNRNGALEDWGWEDFVAGQRIWLVDI